MMTPELFQLYLNGHCTEDEKDQVEHWLHTCTDAELDALLLPQWQHNKTSMPRQQSDELWQQLQTTIRPEQTKPKLITMKWLAAASVIILLCTAGWWYPHKKEKPIPVVAAKEKPVTDWVKITNPTTHPKQIQLSDGSEVKLSTNATLQYKQHFTPNHRDLYLEGKALFTVAKDKQRPFTVYSGAVSTTALGTRFTVNANTKFVSVHLYEGKVVVRHQTETYLHPGQELTYDLQNKTASIKQPVKPKPVTTSPSIRTAKELNFNNTPLPEVFDQLQQQYAAGIEYNKAEVDSMYFTGTISVKDALPLVLKVITQMNGLELKTQAKGYSIGPPSH